MLNWHELPRKSTRQLKEQLKKGLTCTILGCDEPLSHKQGPGGNKLCRKHHKQMREYGGVGRLDRPHTFHRKWTCDWCGVDALEKVRKKLPHLEDADPDLFYRQARDLIVGDHIIRRKDGGDDSEENIQTLCRDCDSFKTIQAEDWR